MRIALNRGQSPDEVRHALSLDELAEYIAYVEAEGPFWAGRYDLYFAQLTAAFGNDDPKDYLIDWSGRKKLTFEQAATVLAARKRAMEKNRPARG